ncbi:peptidogalycan biosysnthesis protein [Pseudofulvibacter geojedonensis]|uniref:Peptidogalycan biosysnthesis protein n=1 Tax=Pseudofulvibacter geojedonensis TaxID=1123758 RepID=A0ABW3I3Y7_9FLAO
MNYTKEIYQYVSEIPETVWLALDTKEKIYFSKDYLKALEAHNSNKIQFYYVVVFNENKAVSLATIQVISFDFSETNFSNNTSKFTQRVAHKLNCFIKRDYVKIVICGNAFLSGEYGVYIKTGEDKKAIFNEIIRGIHKVIKSDRYLKKLTDVILLKDFETASLPITSELKNYNYVPVFVDPNMVLTLNPEWQSFEDYIGAFKSKFRVKAKKAYKTSNSLIAKDFTSEEIITNKEKLTKLYLNVVDKAGFNPEVLNLSTYAAFKNILKDKFVFRVYSLDDEIVGFMSGLVNNDKLDAHYVGIDYALNKEHAIYSRMLYDYVHIGIDKKLKKVDFGRTAGEIKSTLGAVPESLVCYVRHKKSVANFLVKPFLKKIKPTAFEQRHPFKK